MKKNESDVQEQMRDNKEHYESKAENIAESANESRGEFVFHSPDPWAEKLPTLLREANEAHEQVVPVSGWHIPALLSHIPVIGAVVLLAVYTGKGSKKKNVNKRNYAKSAAFWNLIFSFLIIAAAGFAIHHFQPDILGKIMTFRSRQPVAASSSENEVVTSAASSSSVTEISKGRNGFLYSTTVPSFRFYINDEIFDYPLSEAVIKAAGFDYTKHSDESSKNQVIRFSDDEGSSYELRYDSDHPSESDPCARFKFSLTGDSEVSGMSRKLTYSDVRSLFKMADSSDTDEYQADSGNGSVTYTFGKYRIRVDLSNHHVNGGEIYEKGNEDKTDSSKQPETVQQKTQETSPTPTIAPAPEQKVQDNASQEQAGENPQQQDNPDTNQDSASADDNSQTNNNAQQGT